MFYKTMDWILLFISVITVGIFSIIGFLTYGLCQLLRVILLSPVALFITLAVIYISRCKLNRGEIP